MKAYLTLLFMITLCLFMRGYVMREMSNKRYATACEVVYLPEKQRIDDKIIREQEKDELDRNFRDPLDDQFKNDEIMNIIEDKKKSKLITDSSLYPERGSRVDPYY